MMEMGGQKVTQKHLINNFEDSGQYLMTLLQKYIWEKKEMEKIVGK